MDEITAERCAKYLWDCGADWPIIVRARRDFAGAWYVQWISRYRGTTNGYAFLTPQDVADFAVGR